MMGGSGVGNLETIHDECGLKKEVCRYAASARENDDGWLWGWQPRDHSKVKCSLPLASRCGVMKRLRSLDRRAIPPTLAENTATITFVRSFAKRVALEPILMAADRVAAPLGCIEGPATVMSWEEK
jgi:hypothetical protein